MTKITYRINKNDLTIEEQEKVSKYYKGLKATRDTMTEIFEGNDTKYEETYYIFVGNHTPYGACVKHGNRYVFARYSRYDSMTEDFTDFAIDCDESGNDDRVFTTKHFTMTDNTVEY